MTADEGVVSPELLWGWPQPRGLLKTSAGLCLWMPAEWESHLGWKSTGLNGVFIVRTLCILHPCHYLHLMVPPRSRLGVCPSGWSLENVAEPSRETHGSGLKVNFPGGKPLGVHSLSEKCVFQDTGVSSGFSVVSDLRPDCRMSQENLWESRMEMKKQQAIPWNQSWTWKWGRGTTSVSMRGFESGIC